MTEPGRRWMWRHCVEIAVWIPAIPRAWAWHDSVAALAADIEAGTQAVLADAIAYLDVDANSMRVIRDGVLCDWASLRARSGTCRWGWVIGAHSPTPATGRPRSRREVGACGGRTWRSGRRLFYGRHGGA